MPFLDLNIKPSGILITDFESEHPTSDCIISGSLKPLTGNPVSVGPSP